MKNNLTSATCNVNTTVIQVKFTQHGIYEISQQLNSKVPTVF